MNKMKLTKVLSLEIAIRVIKCKSHYVLSWWRWQGTCWFQTWTQIDLRIQGELICEWEKLFLMRPSFLHQGILLITIHPPSFITAPKVLENMELSTGSSEIKVASRDELVRRNLEVFHQSLLESLCSALGNASQEWQWRKLNPTLKNQNPAKKFIC